MDVPQEHVNPQDIEIPSPPQMQQVHNRWRDIPQPSIETDEADTQASTAQDQQQEAQSASSTELPPIPIETIREMYGEFLQNQQQVLPDPSGGIPHTSLLRGLFQENNQASPLQDHQQEFQSTPSGDLPPTPMESLQEMHNGEFPLQDQQVQPNPSGCIPHTSLLRALFQENNQAFLFQEQQQELQLNPCGGIPQKSTEASVANNETPPQDQQQDLPDSADSSQPDESPTETHSEQSCDWCRRVKKACSVHGDTKEQRCELCVITYKICTFAGIPARIFRNYSRLKQDFRLIVPQLQNFKAILLLEKTKLAGADEKTCEARFCLPTELCPRHFISPGPRTRRINATHWLNLFDTTGRRRVYPDGKHSDDNPLQPNRYYHICCMELLIDLPTLIRPQQFKMEKKPCQTDPSKVSEFDPMIELWFSSRISDSELRLLVSEYDIWSANAVPMPIQGGDDRIQFGEPLILSHILCYLSRPSPPPLQYEGISALAMLYFLKYPPLRFSRYNAEDKMPRANYPSPQEIESPTDRNLNMATVGEGAIPASEGLPLSPQHGLWAQKHYWRDPESNESELEFREVNLGPAA